MFVIPFLGYCFFKLWLSFSCMRTIERVTFTFGFKGQGPSVDLNYSGARNTCFAEAPWWVWCIMKLENQAHRIKLQLSRSCKTPSKINLLLTSVAFSVYTCAPAITNYFVSSAPPSPTLFTLCSLSQTPSCPGLVSPTHQSKLSSSDVSSIKPLVLFLTKSVNHFLCLFCILFINQCTWTFCSTKLALY